ncbi:DUF6088 family protein [Pontibacter burrus]|uniref:AbiEi antitoxin C-terminal domain-containing protein n=1 Tax=Pontibacter burrus TaxID=2704466 RepID=A0A6B3LJQ4_9BACT|nr:DUF6088 family protein [Pontibacter burrus]NEM97212.1 hypothetical protein [Pontibacter burrus]
MNVAEKIEKKIGRMEEGLTFKYEQLGISKEEYSAATKATERLIRKGLIKRVSKGVFYKPKKSRFGELKPREEELLKPYLFEGNKRVGYITGNSLYNRMGLTTQVSNTIKIASRSKRISTKLGKVEVKPLKSYVDINDKNYYLLEILDALKDFKIIPDLDKKSGIKLMQSRIQKLDPKEKKTLIKYALEYPPRVRAFLGAIMSVNSKGEDILSLKESLNPLTSYNLGIDDAILPTASQWFIE